MNAAYSQIRAQIQAAAHHAGRNPDEITLIAVSKNQSPEAVAELYQLGHRDFGENYVQELTSKASALKALGCADIRWHFIGHLQTNKVKQLIGLVDTIHTVDSLRLAQEIKRRRPLSVKTCVTDAVLHLFLQVNIDREESKDGALPEETPALAAQIASLPGIALQGLMAIPAQDHPDRAFAALRNLEIQCRPHTQGKLSMGMSADFSLAIAQGATHIRVGTALFGKFKRR